MSDRVSIKTLFLTWSVATVSHPSQINRSDVQAQLVDKGWGEEDLLHHTALVGVSVNSSTVLKGLLQRQTCFSLSHHSGTVKSVPNSQSKGPQFDPPRSCSGPNWIFRKLW